MATFEKRTVASTDDCFVRWTGAAWEIDLTNDNQSAGYQGSTNYKLGGGMRFTNITIPKGSTINVAYIVFTCRAPNSATAVKSRLRGEDIDDAPTFSDIADYNSRDRTSASVDWDNLPAWVVDTEYTSPDIKTVIQEIIDRAGWASGNDLVMFWDDHDDRSTHASDVRRRAYTYDDSSSKCPLLHIEYTPLAAGRSHGYIMG